MIRSYASPSDLSGLQYRCRPAIVALLLEAGADPDAATRRGESALDTAAEAGDTLSTRRMCAPLHLAMCCPEPPQSGVNH